VPCLGLTVYVCPDCDGYEVRDRRTVVLGAGDVGARMALLLRERTAKLVYVNHERKPVSPELERALAADGIAHVRKEAQRIATAGDGRISGVVFMDGSELEAERGFLAFGGNEVRSGLAQQLGAERHENGHVLADPRTKMTSVPGVWAAGDIGVHTESVSVAMGEGMLAAIWMHKWLTAGR
jgi:thioredoxin reductase